MKSRLRRIEKISKTESWFLVKINTIDLFLESARKKEDSKSEIIEETLQLIPQKYKEL